MTILRLLLAAEAKEQGRDGARGMADRVTELARLNAGLDYELLAREPREPWPIFARWHPA